jgi:hypothetical protein
MRAYFVVLAAVVLGGCVAATATSKPIYLPDGTQGFAITCNGNYANWNTCLEEAGKICGPNGYREWERHDEKGYRKHGAGYNGFRGSESESLRGRNMVIGCNPPPAAPVKK